MKKSVIFEVEVLTPKQITDQYKINNILTSRYTIPKTLPREFILNIATNTLGRSAENKYYISDNQGMIWYAKENLKDSTTYRQPIALSQGSYQFKYSDDMEDGISRHWWNRNAAPDQVGINGSVQIESLSGDTLVTFPPDFGQELLLNFIVE